MAPSRKKLTANVLVAMHLIPKLKNPNRRRSIQEADVYNQKPWDLVANATKEEHFCFFTNATESRGNSDGYWVECEGVDSSVTEEDYGQIGTMTIFQYHVLQYGHPVSTRWFISEFDVYEGFRAQYDIPNLPIKLCQIKYLENYPISSGSTFNPEMLEPIEEVLPNASSSRQLALMEPIEEVLPNASSSRQLALMEPGPSRQLALMEPSSSRQPAMMQPSSSREPLLRPKLERYPDDFILPKRERYED